MTVESPPPPPRSPMLTIYSYDSYIALSMPPLVFVCLFVHCLILMILKVWIYPSNEKTTNIISTTTNLISGAEQTSWLKASWGIYFLSVLAGILYFGWYGMWVIDQAPYEGDDPEISSGTFLRDEGGHGTTMDFAVLVFATGVAVANLVQLFVSGKFVTRPKDMDRSWRLLKAYAEEKKAASKQPVMQEVNYDTGRRSVICWC